MENLSGHIGILLYGKGSLLVYFGVCHAFQDLY